MTKQYGINGLSIEPTKRQQLFEAVKSKAVKCVNRTQLCAAIYPWILDLVNEYKNKEVTRRERSSFRAEIYDFHRALSVYISAIPFIVSPENRPLDLEHIRDEALGEAIEMAVNIAGLEVYQISINLSAIMARFVDNL